MVVLDSSLFMYHSNTREFTIEASELSHAVREAGYIGLDERNGSAMFAIRSARTNNTVNFTQIFPSLRDREGDLIAEFYYNAAHNIKVTVYND